MPNTTPLQIAQDYTYNMLKNVDSLHGPPYQEPQQSLVEHALIKYAPVCRFLFFTKPAYSLTPKGKFVLSEIERERSKTGGIEDKVLSKP